MSTRLQWRAARRFSLVVLVAAAFQGGGSTCGAEEPSTATSGLAAAEHAYQEVDFATMHDQATHAVETGGATHDETARLHVLIGIAAAALGQDEEAKRAFIVALGLDPTLKLDHTLSPKIREPYLEAQGYWGAYPERLSLRARAAADGQHLLVELVDPGHLVTRIGLHVRSVGSPAFEAHTVDAERVARFPLPRDARSLGFEFFASGIDDHQNVFVELGNEGDPRVVRGSPEDGSEPGRTAAQAPRQRSYLLPIVLGAAGVAAAGVGVGFQLEREAAAREWNGPGCEKPGVSRIGQCANVDSRRRLDEAAAIGAYTAAGVLVTGGVVALLLGRAPSLERPSATARTSRLVRCALAGPGLSCVGRF